MARLPHILIAVSLLMAWINQGSAQDSSASPLPVGRANQGASLHVQPQRSRLPPVTLAQHSEPAGETTLSDPDTSASPLSMPLRQSRSPSAAAAGKDSQGIDATSSMITVGTSLAVVLGLFMVMTYFVRRNLPKGVQPPPGEVLEVLGRAPLPGKQQLQVVRFGSKLVLLSVTSEGVEAVSEITEPDEVQQLIALCRRDSTGSSSHAFQEILAQMGREPARGFIDQRATKPHLSHR